MANRLDLVACWLARASAKDIDFKIAEAHCNQNFGGVHINFPPTARLRKLYGAGQNLLTSSGSQLFLKVTILLLL